MIGNDIVICNENREHNKYQPEYMKSCLGKKRNESRL